MSEGVPNPLDTEPTIIAVEGSTVSFEIMQDRLLRVMKKLPHLQGAYNSYVIMHGLQTRVALSLTEFFELCNSLSLRVEPFTEWDDDYFEEQFKETIRIAKERGSHP